MTNVRRADRDTGGESGFALLSVLLLLILMSALSSALAVAGRTETMLARNHQYAAQAHAAAEAGLNHGAQVAIAKIALWEVEGFDTSSEALSSLLRGPDNLEGTSETNADNGSLAGLGIPAGGLALAGVLNARYEASIIDEDDPVRGVVPTNVTMAPISENNLPYTDANSRVLIRAVGYAAGGTTVTLEAILAPMNMPAIVSNGDLIISGNPHIIGIAGGVHANEDLIVSGSPDIAQNATASGNYTQTGNPTISGSAGGGQPQIPIAHVEAMDHISKADFILTSEGQLMAYDPVTATSTLVCDASSNANACKAAYGWSYDGAATGGWSISDNGAQSGTYYVEGPASVSGNPGSPGSPLPLSIIAEGSISITGNPDMVPDAPELQFVTNGDLKIAGTIDVPFTVEGLMLVREQAHIAGNPELSGQLLIENVPSVSNLVTENAIVGNATLSYNGTLGGTAFTVRSWREVR
jgi:hypothetical protein